MLSFVEALKQIIANVQATGGAVIEHSFPTPSLIQRLREHAVCLLAEESARHSYVLLEEWFNEGFFEEYIRVWYSPINR